MKILVTGDRHWANAFVIYHAISALHAEYPDLQIVHGDARGADTLADNAAKACGIARYAKPADWNTYGKGAGTIRNQAMLDEHPDIEWTLAFHNNLYESKGTRDMVARSLAKGLPVTNITSGINTWQVKIKMELQEQIDQHDLPYLEIIKQLKESENFMLTPWRHRLPVMRTFKSAH